MVAVRDFFDAIEAVAPFSLAESWDNAGLLVGSMDDEVRGALVALDATDEVIGEAGRLGANLIVTHHPVIFSPLKRIESDSLAHRLIAAGVKVISAHTNLDIAAGGVNDALAARLGLENARPLEIVSRKSWYKVAVTVPEESREAVYAAMAEAGAGRLGNYSHCGFFVPGEGRFLPLEGASPAIGAVGRPESVAETRLEMLASPRELAAVLAAMKAAHPYEEVAYDVYENRAVEETQSAGRVGELPEALPPERLAGLVKERLGARGVRYVDGGQAVVTVAVCGGSGADFLRRAKELGAQALVTGEAKHSQLLEARRLGMTLIDAGHFDTEAVVLVPLAEHLRKRILGVRIAVSEQGPPALYV